jgi:hypothetical protein
LCGALLVAVEEVEIQATEEEEVQPHHVKARITSEVIITAITRNKNIATE